MSINNDPRYTILTNLIDKVINAVKKVTTFTEVIMARGIFDLLHMRLDNFDSKFLDISVNVEDFPLADSETNDTGRVQRAINSLTNGGTILIARTYNVGELTSLDNITFLFTPRGKLNFVSGTTCLKLGNNNILINPKLKETRTFQSLPNTSIGIHTNNKNSILIAGKGSIDGFTFCNIAVVGGDDVIVEKGIECKNAGSKSFDLTTKTPTPVTTKLASNGWEGVGIYITGAVKKAKISAYCHDNGKHGIQAYQSGGMAAEYLDIIHAYCINNGDCGMSIRNVQTFKANDNTCNYNGENGGPDGGQGIQIVGTESTFIVIDGKINNNICVGNKENGIENIYSSVGLTFSNNTCRLNTWAGIKLYRITEAQLTGNKLNNNGTDGIIAQECDMVQIDGITVKNNNYNGVNLATCTNSSVRNFKAFNNGLTSTQKAGVTVSGGSNNSVENGQASDNQTTATQQYGVRIYGVANGLISNVYGSGNITKLVQIDGGSTAITRNNPADTDLVYGGIMFANGIRILSGTGTPEGIVTASIGSLYTRLDGGASTTLYVKQSGTGNTGWVAK